MSDINEILERIRESSLTQQEKGAHFEKLIRNWFLTDRRYADEVEECWRWSDFPYRESISVNDVGIDLVIKTCDDKFWAVQCKFYADSTSINMDDVTGFLACCSKRFFTDENRLDERSFSAAFWVDTRGTDWGKNAEEIIKNQTVEVKRIGIHTLEESEVDWNTLYDGTFGEHARAKPKDLREHQKEAIEKARAYFIDENNDRGKLIMACGTGKTFTALKMTEELFNNGFILFMVPSIALLSQTLNAWKADSKDPFDAVCVCSDSKASQKIKDEDSLDETSVDLAYPACTNARTIRERIMHIREQQKKNGKSQMIAVFSTYQSIDAVSGAQKLILDATKGSFGEFDFIICDEAHRTTGAKALSDEESNFVKIHDNNCIKGRKRLYMTATPKLFGASAKKDAQEKDITIWSMDDQSVYGDEFFRVGFSRAVQDGMLSDYKVLVLTVSENELPKEVMDRIRDKKSEEYNTDDTVKLFGVINGLSKNIKGDDGKTWQVDPGMMRRAVAFCPKIGNEKKPGTSKNVARILPEVANICQKNLAEDRKGSLVTIEAMHIDGTDNASERGKKLSWLKQNTAENICRILSNVRCLSEGVDVPALDAVIFLASCRSQVDVVQSVGRVMRTFKDGNKEKKYGYIIIPIVVPSDVSPEDALDNNKEYKVVWDILNALRSHDERFNAQVNSIVLNKKEPVQIVIARPDGTIFDPNARQKTVGQTGGNDDTAVEMTGREITKELDLFGEFKQGIYARIVQKCGDRFYWENWSAKMGKIAKSFIERIKLMLEQHSEGSKEYQAFQEFLKDLKKNLNPSVCEDDAVEMLAQHMIVRPIFDALFEEYKFSENNAVSKSMQEMLNILEGQGMEKDTRELDKFYKSVKAEIKVDNLEGKQRIIKTLYEKFFQATFPKVTKQLGIVYTPIECVDFIIHSVDDILKKEFNSSISDQGVHILDPFTGTGTFIVRLLQSNLIKPEDLRYKYLHEIHCNEIMLLAYYVADINIEAAYHELSNEKDYLPFDGICLADTFQMSEAYQTNCFSTIMKQNSDRVDNQKKQPIMVCIGNPPYSVGQKSSNDNAQNLHYPMLEKRIDCTYAYATKAGSTKALYDSYVKAFRWASDRIMENGNDRGIVAFISNGGWLEGQAMDGMRRTLEEEFSSIYVLNLRGNQRTSGELSRREGGKIFGSGARTPVNITFLVKNGQNNGKAVIHYHDIGDYLSREDKLTLVKEFRSVNAVPWKIITPNDKFDWINQRGDKFDSLISIEPEKKFTESNSFFKIYSLGCSTNKDAFLYNYSKSSLTKNVCEMIGFYNKERENSYDSNYIIKYDPTKIVWTDMFKKDLAKNIKYEFDNTRLTVSMYRPFTKVYFHYQKNLIQRTYRMTKFFPAANSENLVICLSGTAKGFTCMITNSIVDLHFVGDTQCFPMYYYTDNSIDSKGEIDLLTDISYDRKDGITNGILKEFQELYHNGKITKEQIFYYVYGILHSPDYRKTFENELKKSLPRIPVAETLDDFLAFEKAGRELAELHLKYEEQQPWPNAKVSISKEPGTDEYAFYKVDKMKFPAKGEKERIIYNPFITIENIPAEAYEYVVNGKSAIEWIMDRYQIRVDKDSLIKNDPNDWGREHNKPRYILDLLLSIITVSMETVKIVKGLPKLDFEKKGSQE